jgi:hypothetical protein
MLQLNDHDGANVKGMTISEKSRTDYIKHIITTALLCTLLKIKTSCETVQDFDYILECFKDKGRFLRFVDC